MRISGRIMEASLGSARSNSADPRRIDHVVLVGITTDLGPGGSTRCTRRGRAGLGLRLGAAWAGFRFGFGFGWGARWCGPGAFFRPAFRNVNVTRNMTV